MTCINIGGAGGIRTHTGRILSPVPLPLGYGPVGMLSGCACRRSDAEILAQPSDVAGCLHRVLCLLDLARGVDYERRPDDADRLLAVHHLLAVRTVRLEHGLALVTEQRKVQAVTIAELRQLGRTVRG